MNEKNEFKPYIPADKVTPEITVTSVIMGILLAVVFGAANAYLGLRVGMTVSASIPAAVIAMGIANINKIKSTNPSGGGASSAPAVVSPPSVDPGPAAGLPPLPGRPGCSRWPWHGRRRRISRRWD